MTGRVTRRTAILGGVGAVAVGLPRGARAAVDVAALLRGSGQVIVCTWGGSYTDAQRRTMFDPFSKATGIQVITTGSPDAAKLKLMEATGSVQWDLIDAEGQMMIEAVAQHLLTPVDYDLVYQVAPRMEFGAGSTEPYGFASVAYGWILVWNTRTFPANPPQSWADFWNVDRFKGRRAMYAEPKPMLEVALLADGVARDKLYPLDVDLAYRMLDRIKPHVDVFVADTGQYDVLMQNSEVDLLLCTTGRTVHAKQNGAPFDFTFNDGLWEQSYWIVPKSAPNAGNAMKLLAWMAQPGVEADFADQFDISVPNTAAYALMKPGVAATLPTAPANLGREVRIDAKWWADNLDAMNRRWLDWYSRR